MEPACASPPTQPNATPSVSPYGVGRWSERVLALALCTACSVLLIVAYQLHADPDGVGTHQQLGLAACGFLGGTGWPCATCGMTTAFAAAAHGNILLALEVQPAGGVFAIGTAMLTILSGWAAISGAAISVVLKGLLRPAMLWAIAGLILAAWAYKAYSMGAVDLAVAFPQFRPIAGAAP